jgi:fido (protein-threonine AMPylation protein)
MVLKNKLGITDQVDLAKIEEKISKQKAKVLFDQEVIDWNSMDKEAYLSSMERSVVNDVEIKVLLRSALTDRIDDREIYMKGIDVSYYYEGYSEFKIDEL